MGEAVYVGVGAALRFRYIHNTVMPRSSSPLSHVIQYTQVIAWRYFDMHLAVEPASICVLQLESILFVLGLGT